MEAIRPQEEVKNKKVSLFPFFLLFTLMNILFNLLGLSYVKFAFLGQAAVLTIMILTSDQKLSFWALVVFAFFEGQGRVIMGYNILFRLIFDILIGLLVLRAIISEKKMINREVVPNYMIIGIFLLFIWYVLELFNPNGAGVIPGLVTSKIYIFPLLLFFYFQNFPIDLMGKEGQRFLLLITMLLFFSSLVVVVQAQFDETFVHGISSNYENLFANYKKFTGYTYRPWGFSYGPGAMTVYFFLALPFLLIFNPSVLYPKSPPARTAFSIFKWLTFLFMCYASFICQVRSATLKLILIFGAFSFFKFLGSRFKFRSALVALGLLFVAYLSVPLFSQFAGSSSDIIERAAKRYEGLAESGFIANRAGFDLFMDIIDQRIEFPFGYGIGMTTNFLPDFEERRKQHVNIPKLWFWHHDNLFLFLFIELGFGALIYLFILFSLNISLFARLITLLRWGEASSFVVVSVCAVTVFIITGLNWGAVGIPFNPESFFYWFWAGMAFNVFKETRDKRNEMDENQRIKALNNKGKDLFVEQDDLG